MNYFLIFFEILLAIEIVFRIVYRIKKGHSYFVTRKISWKKMHVISHPHLSFAYKRNSIINDNKKLSYTLHFNEYFSFKNPIKINNMGHFGDDFSFLKPNDVIRIACLGDSTTANNIATLDDDYSYPTFLEKKMRERLPNGIKPEVYNCGIGGWVSSDIMIDFMLNIIRTKPDYVIIYHGYMDLHLYLSNDFKPDYSHNRLNFGEKIKCVKSIHRLPKVTFWHSYECLKDMVLGTGNTRNDVLRMIVPNKVNFDMDFCDLTVEKDIIKNILIICKYYGIKVILSSFAYYNYDNTKISNKYRDGVERENIMMFELSKEFGLKFVDQDAIMPKNEKYFLDHVHLTPEGMSLLSENFVKAIIETEGLK
jgi:lysophospholipase L1-like esterase